MEIIEGKKYLIKDLIPDLEKEASETKDNEEKLRMIDALRPYSEQYTIWRKRGSGWGSSILNPTTWLDAETLEPFLDEEGLKSLSSKSKGSLSGILLNDVFPEIKKLLSGHPLSNRIFGERKPSNKRFSILGNLDGSNDDRIYYALTQLTKGPICVAVACRNNNPQLAKELKDLLSNDPNWKFDNYRLSDDSKCCFVYSKSEVTSESIDSEAFRLHNCLLEVYDLLQPKFLGGNIAMKRPLVGQKIVFQGFQPSDFKENRIRIPKDFDWFFPDKKVELSVSIKNKNFACSFSSRAERSSNEVERSGQISLRAKGFTLLDPQENQPVRIEFLGVGEYKIDLLTSFEAVSEFIEEKIKESGNPFLNHFFVRDSSHSPIGWFGIPVFNKREVESYLPLHYEWNNYSDSVRFQIHLEKSKNQPQKWFDTLISAFEEIPSPKGWKTGKWLSQPKCGRRFENEYAISYSGELKHIAEQIFTDLIQANSDFSPHFQKFKSIFLSNPDANTTSKLSNTVTMNSSFPLNQIIFGPPGTGKTYHTVNRALEIINPKFYAENKDNREALHKEFDRLLIKDWNKDSGQIAFCTFHQSMSYEDFIEGIKPVLPKDEVDSELGGDRVSYRIESGIFKKLCQRAQVPITEGFNFDLVWEQFFLSLTPGTIFKSHESELTIEKEVSNVNSIKVRFTNSTDPEEEKGKRVFTVTKNIAKRLFEAGIAFDAPIRKWVAVRDVVGAGRATTSLAVYKSFWDFAYQKGYFKKEENPSRNFVLIIDEINRGNVSQIFGELITLIEEDKRDGKPEALEVILPYSKEPFSVPSNLYIIGTMNTADRSVEALDTALRRRFVFEEMGPKPKLLTPAQIHRRFWIDQEPWPQEKVYDYEKIESELWRILGVQLEDEKGYKKFGDFQVQPGFTIDVFEEGIKGMLTYNGLNFQNLLETINSRIEVMLSKDHQIGHSYFMKVYSEDELKTAFYKSIIPLLQEYFYGDYGKIGLVLGRGFVASKMIEKPSTYFDFPYDDHEELASKAMYEIVDYRKTTEENPTISIQLTNDKRLNFSFLDAVRRITDSNYEPKP